MKILSILILLLTFVFSATAQDKKPVVYQVKNIYQNADLNEKAINIFQNNTDFTNDTDEILKLFKPVKGKYKVIVFVASNYGLLADDRRDISHNILILKINNNNEILDGLEYCLEWAEPPFTSRFARVSKKGVRLRKGLPISELDFQTLEAAQPLSINGIIDNLYDLKEIF